MLNKKPSFFKEGFLFTSTINFLYIFLFISNNFYATNYISSISTVGNSKTPNQIILKQIQHPINQTFNPTIAFQDQQRIYKLDIFTYVHIGYLDSAYMVIVQEKKNLSVQPLIKNFTRDEKIKRSIYRIISSIG